MKRASKLLRVASGTGSLIMLTACAGLRDVDHKWCPPEAEPEPVAVRESINLSADALFAFDRSGVSDMLPQGRTELDRLITKVNTDYERVETIQLVGHTDRLGAQAYNQQLSQHRANTVMHYLQSKGVTTNMTATGAGESQPVSKNCVGEKATAELIACLQPDRRVEVIIQGVAAPRP